jgi:autotransporter translocation and assembly factor TamB
MALLSALMVLLFVALTLATLPPGEFIIRRIGEKQIGRLLNSRITIGGFETNLISYIRLRDLRIAVPPDSDVSLAVLKHAEIHYNLLALLRKELSLTAVEMQGLTVAMRRDSSGTLNLPGISKRETRPQAPPDTSKKTSFRIVLHRLKIADVDADFTDAKSVLHRAQVNDLSLTADRMHADTYRLRLRIKSATADWSKSSLSTQEMSINASFQQKALQIESLKISLPDLEFSGGGILTTAGELQGKFSLSGRPDSVLTLLDEYIPKVIKPARGYLDAEITVGGKTAHPEMQAEVRLSQVGLADLALDGGFIRGGWRSGEAKLDSLNLAAFGGAITAQGTFHTGSAPDLSASLTFNSIDFKEIWRFIYHERSSYTGRISGSVNLAGPLGGGGGFADLWRKSEALAEVQLQDVTFLKRSLPDFSLYVEHKNERADLSVVQGESRILASLRADSNRIQGNFSADIPQIPPYAGLFKIADLSGKMKAQGEISGTLDAPSFHVELALDSLNYQNFPLDSLRGTLEYASGRLLIRSARFAGAWQETDSLKPPFGIMRLSGGLRYRGDVHGFTDDLKGDVIVNLIQPGYGNYHADEGFARFKLTADGIRLEPLYLRQDSLLVSIRGSAPLSLREATAQVRLIEVPPDYRILSEDATFPDYTPPEPSYRSARPLSKTSTNRTSQIPGIIDIRLDLAEKSRIKLSAAGESISVQDLAALLPNSPDLGGQLYFDLEFAGSPKSTEADLRFHLNQPSFQNLLVDSLGGEIAYQNGLIHLKRLELYDPDLYSYSTVIAEASRDSLGEPVFNNRSKIKGSAIGRNLDLRILNPFFAGKLTLAGQADYDFFWEGTLRDLHPQGIVELKDGKVFFAENKTGIEDIAFTLTLRDSVLELNNLQGAVQNLPFTMRTRLTSRDWQDFLVDLHLAIADSGSLSAVGEIAADSSSLDIGMQGMKLSLLQPFIPEVENLSGDVNLNLRLTGRMSNPEATGKIQARNCSAFIPPLGQSLRNGMISASLDGNTVNIDSVFARLGEGTLLLAGELQHERGIPSRISLQLDLNKLKIDRPDILKLTLDSGHLEYRNQDPGYLLSGDLRFGETRIVKDLNPQEFIAGGRAPGAVEATKPPPLLSATALNIKVRDSDRIWLDNNVARLRALADISIVGTLLHPNFTGRISLEEGYVMFLDRKFAIEQGTLDFLDPDRINPNINLTAKTSVRTYQALEATTYEILLTLTGTPEDVKVELSSTPPLENADIVSLITLGATRQQLTGNGVSSKTGDILVSRAESLSSYILSGYISRNLGEKLGLDEISIEGNLFVQNDTQGPRIAATKQISDRLEITYLTNVGHFNENGIRMIYRLSRQFSLQGETIQTGETGIDLKYEVRFR